ncbi:MAG TPA: hypothetical protein VMK84_04195 [Streptosporangiaceae bacterium]|nr:hypothetical protein [Streptosporangiaceae bacterium]
MGSAAAVFRRDGTWRKPAGAQEVDVVLAGADAWDGTPGQVVLHTFGAAELPDTVEVTVGARLGGGGGNSSFPVSTGTNGRAPDMPGASGGDSSEVTVSPYPPPGVPPARYGPGRSEVAAGGFVVVITRY